MTKFIIFCLAGLLLLALLAQQQNIDLTPSMRTVGAPVVSYTFEVDSSSTEKVVVVNSFKALNFGRWPYLPDTLSEENFYSVKAIPGAANPSIEFSVFDEDSTYDNHEARFFVPWHLYDSLRAAGVW